MLFHDIGVFMLLLHHVWPQSHGLRWQLLPSGCRVVKGGKKRRCRAALKEGLWELVLTLH